MLKLLSQGALKAVPRSFRLTSPRQIHSIKAPYSGPASYDMIARRFSPTEVDPLAYFTPKRQQAAKERGEFIDIHDTGSDPNEYEGLIIDMKHETLETTIAEDFGIPYLLKATEADAKAVTEAYTGYIYGWKRRAIFPFIVGHESEACWVFFLIFVCNA
jgi:hypothetical protein